MKHENHDPDEFNKDLYDSFLFNQIQDESNHKKPSPKYSTDPIFLLIVFVFLVQLFSCANC